MTAACMRPALHDRVRAFLSRHQMLAPGDAVGVAVSGGADSVALLLLLEELREALGIRLAVLHFNHQLRGAEADADEQFVAQIAAARPYPLFAAREDVGRAAREQGWNLEDVARRLRYQFFSSVVQAGRVTRVAVAHTADDQAETVLAHLLRGTGPAGLAAIYPVAGHIVRPLLAIRRRELREYLAARGQDWREDSTNLDTSRLRARIRQNLLPQLERDFQPQIVAGLGRLAELSREDAAFWELLAAERAAQLTEKTSRGAAIRAADLLAPLPSATVSQAPARSDALAALRKRLVRRIVADLKGDARQLDAQHVEQVLHLAGECANGSRVTLPGGVVIEKESDRLWFSLAKNAQAAGPETLLPAQTYEYRVELGGQESAVVSVPEIGRRFRLKSIDWPSSGSETKELANALDQALLRFPLVLRNWRPGDSYRPHGRRRAHKLKQLLHSSRVAGRARQGWPVLTSGGSLVWARGLPVAEEFAAGPDTKAGIVIAEEDW